MLFQELFTTSVSTKIYDSSGNYRTYDSSGNYRMYDASGNPLYSDAAGNYRLYDASGNYRMYDASGNLILTKDSSGTKDSSSGTKDSSGNPMDSSIVDSTSHYYENGRPLLISFTKVTSKVGIQSLLAALVIFVILGFIFRKSEGSSFINTAFDGVFFGTLLLYGLYQYLLTSETIPKYFINELDEFYHDQYSFISLFLYIASFYIVVFFVKLQYSEFNPLALLFVELVALPLMGTLIIHYCLLFFVGLDVFKEFRILLRGDQEVVVQQNPTTPIQEEKNEVFHISGNKYTYDDAQAVCKAHNSRLANYDELESAYNNGGEWCSYGWSAEQMAFFPTQKNSWDELQKSKDSKNKCGRPGVNGGYFANPNIKFGVNCFGQKPAATENDLDTLERNKIRPIPQTKEEKIMDKKIEFWKNQNINLNSFNKNKWSRY